jgi:hypothetical protein
MGHARLTTKQAEALRRRVQPMLKFLGDCRRRLDFLGADPHSKLYQAIARAYDAMHSLHVTAHYESIGRGVGESPKDDDSGP